MGRCPEAGNVKAKAMVLAKVKVNEIRAYLPRFPGKSSPKPESNIAVYCIGVRQKGSFTNNAKVSKLRSSHEEGQSRKMPFDAILFF